MVPVYDLDFVTQILISGLVHVAIRNILYFNSEFILANTVIICKCYCNIVVGFFMSNWLRRLGNHSLCLRLKIKLPFSYRIFKP